MGNFNHKYLMYVRKFLNLEKNSGTASILASIVCKGYNHKDVNKDEDYDYVNTELVISDCGKSINLSFDMEDEEEYVNGVYKLETLITTLKEFKEAFIQGREIHLKIKDRRRKEQKERMEEEKAESVLDTMLDVLAT